MMLYIKKLPPEGAFAAGLARRFSDRFKTGTRGVDSPVVSDLVPEWRRHMAKYAHLDPSFKVPDVVVSEAAFMAAVG